MAPMVRRLVRKDKQLQRSARLIERRRRDRSIQGNELSPGKSISRLGAGGWHLLACRGDDVTSYLEVLAELQDKWAVLLI